MRVTADMVERCTEELLFRSFGKRRPEAWVQDNYRRAARRLLRKVLGPVPQPRRKKS